MTAKIERIGIVGLGYVGLPLAVAFGEAGDRGRRLRHRRRAGRPPERRRERHRGRARRASSPPSATLFSASTDPAVLARLRRDPDLRADAARQPARARPLLRRAAPARRSPACSSAGQTVRARVDDLPGDHPRGAAAAARGLRPPGGHRLPPRLLAGAHRPRPLRSHRRQHAEGRRRDHRRLRASARPRSTRRSASEVVTVSSPEAAELSKLLENIFRSVNIALVNELAQLTDRLGIDIWEVIDAAATKPFGFMRFEPGPGMGGHCLPVDPFYLAFKAREHRLLHGVRRARRQDQPVAPAVLRAQDGACPQRRRQAGQRLARADPRRLLQGRRRRPAGGARAEDHPPPPRARRGRLLPRPTRARARPSSACSSTDLDAGVAAADLVAIVTAHPEVDHLALVETAKLLVDFRGVTRGIEAPNLVRL